MPETDIPYAILLQNTVQIYINPLINILMLSHSLNKKSTQQGYEVKHIYLIQKYILGYVV